MKSKAQFIEPLEARIAPALLVNGGNLLGGGTNPTTGETSTGANTVTLVKVISGQALVFFDHGTITGISVGKHTQLDINGSIAGDIVTNLGPDGRLTDSDNNPINGEDGGILLPVSIKGITTHQLASGDDASIGRIIAGGSVKNVNVAGQLGGIYAGDGIFRNGPVAVVNTGTVDYNTVQPMLQNTFTLSQAISTPGANASVKNVTVQTAAQLEVFAGNGLSSDSGIGGVGGSIKNVTVTATLAAEGTKPVVFLHSGDGGAGANGGAGGSITAFNDQKSIAYVRVETGSGGDASGGSGGAGGSLDASTIVSSSPRYDLLMGHGGSGDVGGVGGSIKTLSFTNNITGGSSLIATSDLNHDGLADVVLLNSLTGEATVSLGTATTVNKGEANFQVALQSVTQANGTVVQTPFLPAEGGNPTSLVVADFNGDGFDDFAVSYSATNTLGVYTNHDDGTFAAAQVVLPVSPTRLVAGDFNNAGHEDLAIVSADSTTTAQGGLSSQVFIASNDGAGHFTVGATAVSTLAGKATAVAAAPTFDADGNATGANLFVGLKSGNVTPLLFRGGAPTIGTDLIPFKVPVDSLDAQSLGTGTALLAFSKNISATQQATDPTVADLAEVLVYTLGSDTKPLLTKTFSPDGSTTAAHFIGESGLIGTISPSALTAYGQISGIYSSVATLAPTGKLQDFATTVINGETQFAASSVAENQFFFTTGNPGSAEGVAPFLSAGTPFQPRIITFASGDGGNGDGHAGGDGGTIKALTYTQTLDSGVHDAGGSYLVTLTSGHGGDSNAATGGKGGSLQKSSLSLDPAAITYADDTDAASFLTGAGGQGATGGAGGLIKKVSTTTVYTASGSGGADPGSVAVKLQTGDGGVGTSDAGGAGGSIKLIGQAAFSGISFVDVNSISPLDPALSVIGGNGGAGVTTGGQGGSLAGVGTQNAAVGSLNTLTNQLGSALLASGNGGAASNGDGGSGGDITNANVTVSGVTFYNAADPTDIFPKDGSVIVATGDGGLAHGGRGGAGGSVVKGTVGSVDGDPARGYGVFVAGGGGGDGDAGGGHGGGINGLQMNSSSASTLYAAVIAAGHGGNALVAGTGGAGGDVAGIKQTKDVNSAINVVQAGNGGRGAGDVGGVGGSVTNVNTSGFLGLPSTQTANLGVFHNTDSVPAPVASLFASANLPQGVFAGQGGDGADNGSVTNIVARQIAAIGASVQANGTFAAAKTVGSIQADLIGYQVNRGEPFQSSDGLGSSPSVSAPVDGFILASVVSDIDTIDNDRTALFTFTS